MCVGGVPPYQRRMSYLVDGQWKKSLLSIKTENGRFIRKPTEFHACLSREADAEFPAVAGRYHLYVADACPWAHRTLIVRRLKQLEDVISVSTVQPLMLENGWEFSEDYPDHIEGVGLLGDIYLKTKADYTGRITVPVLWDKERKTIVNNESSEIIRMLNRELGGRADLDLYPEPLRAEIDEVNDEVYDNVNNGVYKAGFASTQGAYEEAVTSLFRVLDKLEQRLSAKNYLVGNTLTEADIRLFTTLIRFDAVYYGHFKCNIQALREYPNLWRFTRRIYQMPEVKPTVRFPQIKEHYYGSHRGLNPKGIVPVGPHIDYDEPV